MRPATASFVSGGSAWWPSSSRLASRCARRSSPASRRCSGTSSPRISSARSTRAHAATAACAERRRFASSKFTSRLTPARTSRRWRSWSHSAAARSAPICGERGADGLALAHDDARHPAHLAGLGGMPSRCAAPTSAMAASGAGQVISSAADRPGSLSVPAARNAPRQIAARSAREPVVSLFGQPAHGPAPLVEQAGLTGERLAALDHADGVVAAVARARALHVHEFRTHAVDLHRGRGRRGARGRRSRARPRPRRGWRSSAGRPRTAGGR